MSEIWKDIPDYEGMYQVSNLGRFKSLKFGKELILKETLSSSGYKMVGLFKDSKLNGFSIHQLIAVTFLNHTANGHNLIVDHINNNKLDNRLENLQIISHRKNLSKDKKNKTSKYTGVSWNKLKNKWVAQIRINGIVNYLGQFDIEQEASNAYQLKLKTL
jgi:hypothetical protein